MRFLFFALLLSLALPLAACETEPQAAPQETASEENSIPFRQDGRLQFVEGDETLATIAIEIADNDSSRTRGLMQRTSLPEQSGMLFIFDREEPQSFWMANTPLALDLFFVDADSQIVSIAKYTKPFSPQAVASEAPARFVIETPAGFADTHGIIESSRVRILDER